MSVAQQWHNCCDLHKRLAQQGDGARAGAEFRLFRLLCHGSAPVQRRVAQQRSVGMPANLTTHVVSQCDNDTMTLRCCTVCGEPSERSRCPEHQPRDDRTGRGVGHANDDPVFRAISRRLRKLSPFCQRCGARDDLTVDHIIPTSEAPELAREGLNMRVLCRTCNSRRGQHCTDTERASVLAATAARKRRKSLAGAPIRRVSPQRLGGAMPPIGHIPPRGPRQNVRYTPRGGMR